MSNEPAPHTGTAAPLQSRPAAAGGDAAREPDPSARRKAGGKPPTKRAHAWATTVLLYVLLAFASIGVAGGTFLFVASPADVVRDRLAAHVLAHTGRQLSVRGGASLVIFPSPGMVLRDAELAPPPGAAGPPAIVVGQLEAYATWRDLLRGRIAAHRLVLRRPVVDLKVDAEGRRNWDFTSLAGPRPVRLAQALPRFSDSNAVPPELHEALRKSLSDSRSSRKVRGKLGGPALRNVRILDGTIRYGDLRVGSTYTISDAQFDFTLGSRHEPIQLSGSLALGGEEVAMEGDVRRASDDSAKVALRLNAPSFAATWDGRVVLHPALEAEGRLAARASAVGGLARWTGMSITGDEDAVGFEGLLRASASTYTLQDAKVDIGGTIAQGVVAVDMTRDRPLVKADLKLASLDLDQFGVAGRANDGDANTPAPDLKPGGAPSGSDSEGGVLRRAQDDDVPVDGGKAHVRGFSRRAGGAWSREPINLTALGRVNVDAKLDAARFVWHGLDMTAATLRIDLQDGQLNAELIEARVYEGRGRGALKVRSDGQAAVVIFDATLEDVAAQPLLQGLADLDWIEGRGTLGLTLAGRGTTEREIVDSLRGQADIKIERGAVIGWDVAAIAREARRGRIPELERTESAKTHFEALSGSFALSDGIARNKDFLLSGGGVKLAGEGTLAFRDRRIDYTVEPTLILDGKGGPAQVNVPIPIRIHGPWRKPQLSPRLEAVLQDPRTAEKVQQIGRKLRGGDIEGAVKGLLGDGPEAEKKAAKAKKLLDRFLKQ